MADTVRVVFRWTLGATQCLASEEELKKEKERMTKVMEEWKSDPGIKFICWFVGSGLDGYGHHIMFEVDDVFKVREMDRAVWAAKPLVDKYNLEIVWGDTTADEYWTS